MGLVLTHAGGVGMWQMTLDWLNYGWAWVHLFGSNYVPTHNDVWSTWTPHEVSGVGGYAPQQLVNPSANWTLTDNPQGKTATYIPLIWSFSAAVTIYGYFVGWDGPGQAWFAEQFAVAYTFPAGGGVFTFTLSLPLISIP